MRDVGRPPEGVDAQQVLDVAGGGIGCGQLQVKLTNKKKKHLLTYIRMLGELWR